MSDLTLRIEREDDVTMPGSLIDGGLTLAQLGALFVFVAMEQGFATFENQHMGTPEMNDAIKALKNCGVLDAKVDGGAVRIVIDLDKAVS